MSEQYRFRTKHARGVFIMSVLAVPLGSAAYAVSWFLLTLIHLITNLAFYGQWSYLNRDPAGGHLGWWTIITPAIGGVVVGVMARYGSAAIRGHGIPEAMEQILTNSSRIPWVVAVFKPTSSAIAIGTGGPFGAEGPIISTGGAFGSILGQFFPSTGAERKILLSAGAAAGMTAIFGAPISAVLLAVELLLFEFRLRSLAPVAIACGTAMTWRTVFQGTHPTFPCEFIPALNSQNFILAILLGALMGFVGVYVSKAVYYVEDLYEKLPVHWMWWPAIGGLVAGAIGLIQPRTLGVGYSNIDGFLNPNSAGTWGVKFTVGLMLSIFVWKFISWTISLSSGTSGGTLAPLFTIGGCLGGVIGYGFHSIPFFSHISIALAALIGMAAIFSSASGALMAAAVFALETTQQWDAAVPLLAACAVACLVAKTISDATIMTEKIIRRGIVVPDEYSYDPLDALQVADECSQPAVSMGETVSVEQAKEWVKSGELAAHNGIPLVDKEGKLTGMVTRAEILAAENGLTLSQISHRDPISILGTEMLKTAAEKMIVGKVGHLPVVDKNKLLVGMITRSDILEAERSVIADESVRNQYLGSGNRPEGPEPAT